MSTDPWEGDELYPCDECTALTRCTELHRKGVLYYCSVCWPEVRDAEKPAPRPKRPLSQHPHAVHATPLPWNAKALLRVAAARTVRYK